MNVLVRESHLFFNAWVNFTRLPCPAWVVHSSENLQASIRYLPLIGIIIGTAGASVYILSEKFFPQSLAILVSMLTTVWLTGAFHEDGFADVCDGFGGGWDKTHILSIMKDSGLGTYGVLGLIFLLTAKFLVLSNLPTAIPVAIIAGHSLSRLMAISLIYTHDYVQSDDMSKVKELTKKMSNKELFFSAAIGLAPLLLMGFFLGSVNFIFIPLIFVILSRHIMANYFLKRIGGYTGDCLGAVQQLTEIIFYCVVYLLWTFI